MIPGRHIINIEDESKGTAMFTQTRRLAVTGHRAGIFRRLLAATALHRQRRSLRDLDDARLTDIGLTRAEAEGEAARSAWDVPPGWRL